MVITSYGFLLIFLPLTFLIYWRIPQKLTFLCITSYLFYALGGLIFVPLLIGLSFATYWLALRKRFNLGIALNLLALIFFKYWNFGADTLNAFGHAIGITALVPLLNLALPLGISFFVFKHIGYLLDIRGERFAPVTNPLLFLTYSAFFPQISAGPMSVSDDIFKQLANLSQTIQSDQVYQGIASISIGLVKKILIADVLNTALQTALFASPEANNGFFWAWCSVGMYALQLYFDFSSYTDIVLGVGILFGVTLPPNFNNPYLATSPSDFWQRWHISLSTWFRFYLFFPLSRTLIKRWGTIQSALAQYAANFVTMVLIGLWHGAGWGFFLWGLYHGLLLNLFAWAKRRKWQIEGHTVMIVCILIGWALFLSPNLTFAGKLFSNMIGLHGLGSLENLLSIYKPLLFFTFLTAILLTIFGTVEAANMPNLKRPVYAFTLGVLAVFCLIHLAAATKFIYIQF
ncbi:MAG: MBOAT family O-acyltransferase [Chloroflexota bacterium]